MKGTLKEQDVEKIRQDFPILQRQINGKRLVYLDNSATSQRPRQVLEAMTAFSETSNANVHRGIHTLSEEATIAYEQAHQTVARFINARSMEVAFTKNTTESLNLLAYTLTRSLKPGDEILLTQMEHHSNIVPWQQLAKERGLVVKFLEIKENGELKSDWSAITPKTRIVSLTQMSNVTGAINPVKAIAKAAHENNALVVVDAAQSVPHFPVDVQKLGVDFLAFSGHKMCGPTGIGVLYGKEALLEEMPPFLYGGGMIKEVTFQDASFTELPWKFEAGTAPITEAVGLAAAIDYLNKTGMGNIFSHEKSLTSYAIEGLEESGVRIIGPQPDGRRSNLRHPGRGGVVSFTLKGIHPHDISTILDQDAIAVRGGHHCCMPLMTTLNIPGTTRASFYLYNTKTEIDRLIAGVKKARKVFA